MSLEEIQTLFIQTNVYMSEIFKCIDLLGVTGSNVYNKITLSRQFRIYITRIY